MGFLYACYFMDKKQYLLKILDQLEPIWRLAYWLKVLVKSWNLEDNTLDVLINAVKWAIHNTKSEIDREKLEKWLHALEKMKELEKQSVLQDQKDLNYLDNLLDSI